MQLLLERGRFRPSDTIATAAAVQCYAIGLVGYSAARIASPVFYALRQSRVAVAISTAAIVVNLVLSLMLVRVFGYRGLALATSLAACVNGGLVGAVSQPPLGGLDGKRLASTLPDACSSRLPSWRSTVESVSRLMLLLLTGSGLMQQLCGWRSRSSPAW